MSNERIDQIMHEHELYYLNTELSSFHQKIYSRTVKAMQQYGAEQYQKGRLDQEKVELFKLELQAQEAIRLGEIVKAQKELIEMYKYGVQNWRRYDELYNQIKSLEK